MKGWQRASATALAAVATAGPGTAAHARPAADPAQADSTFRVNTELRDINLDPSQAYGTTSWWIEYATAAKLFNYPDKPGRAGVTLVPEAATSLPRPTEGGKKYTLKVRKGLKLANGSAVTAKNFKAALERALAKGLRSPGARHLTDVVGYGAARNKARPRLAGVKADGRTLTIRLKRPDPVFLHKLATPYFQAIPTDLPPAPVLRFPSGGPYFVAQHDPGRAIVLQQNRHYSGPRPHRVDLFVIRLGYDRQRSLEEVRTGVADYHLGSLPPGAYQDLANAYGVNQGRFQVRARLATDFLVLNTRSGIFRNVNLRRAANFAIRRTALVDASSAGAYAGSPSDQILPPSLPGFRNASLYPVTTPDVERARRLAGGARRRATLLFPPSALGDQRARIVRDDLAQIGIVVEAKPFAGLDLYAARPPSSSYDAAFGSWVSDFPDPYDYLNILLAGENAGSTNLSYFSNPAYNRRLRRAARLSGKRRRDAYAKVERDILGKQAPLAPFGTPNARAFFSERVNPNSLVYQPIYGDFSIPALGLK
jgi:peptide/nickel transport system substrate-binding protein